MLFTVVLCREDALQESGHEGRGECCSRGADHPRGFFQDTGEGKERHTSVAGSSSGYQWQLSWQAVHGTVN